MNRIKLFSFIIYYGALLFAIIVMDNLAAPSIILRLAYLTLFSLPVLINFPQHFPAMLIAYMSVGTNHFAFTYFPYDMNYYPVLALTGLYFLKQKRKLSNPPEFLITFTLVIFLVDFFTGFQIESAFYCFMTLLLFTHYIKKYDNCQKDFFMNIVCVMAIAISYIYFANFQSFLSTYASAESGVERGGWNDPNYLATTIGMGIMAALTQLLGKNKAKISYRLFWSITIVCSLIAMVIMASRGAILAVSISSIFLIFCSNTNKKIKFGVILCLLVLVIFLLNSSYIELLQYRLENESGDGGNGRFSIWEFKIKAFFSEGNFLNLLFGYGYDGALYLGKRGYWAIHNDFIAILCNYGILGLSMFIYMLYYPIRISCSNNRIIVISLLLYLVLCSTSLEPFSAGRLSYFGFYLLILSVAKS